MEASLRNGAPPAGVSLPAETPSKPDDKPRATLAELFNRLGSSPQGLTRQEAIRRLAVHGPNDPTPAKRHVLLTQFVQAAANPLNIILLVAGGVSAVLGESFNAGLIVVMVLLSVGVNFFQTYSSQQAAERLRGQVAPTATVLRDGVWAEVQRSLLVPGDVIRLSAGALAPADARLIEARDLHVQQAALTGESLPVEKEADPGLPPTSDPAADTGSVFLGTSVVSGTATALVVATGRQTVFGDIAARLATRPPETDFDRGTRQFGMFIMRTIFVLVVFVFLVSAAEHHNLFESLLFAVALAVGLTPEFLPMITAVTLSQGAVHMARQKVIVKNLAAIQNFGSIDILCSDKTGTLTSGEMSLDRHLDVQGTPAEQVFVLAYLNSHYSTGVRNPVDTAILQGRRADPLDTAILRHDHPDVQSHQKIDEVPFDFDRRRASVVVRMPEGTPLLITKGAPENVLAVCTTWEAAGQVRPLDPPMQAHAIAVYQDLSAEGYRVLAVAYRQMPEQAAYRIGDEHDLTLLGFLSFADPPLSDAAPALRELHDDGVRVVILTGDNELVARHVCGEVGLDATRIVLGSDIDRLTDPALAQLAERSAVFARVSPAQKNRIILALKSRGHVVGYMGDGINDAPSLHAADVGISVSGGVDVAKDAADIILLVPGLRVLQAGILEGRRAFGNVMKYLLMGTSSNFGNMFSMAAAALFLPFLPLLPTQILLNNFLYDLAQVSIPTDNVDASFIRKPRRWDIGLIRNFMLFIGPISSLYDFLTFGVLLWVFQAGETLFHTGWFVESLATQTLVLFVIRTAGNPLQSRPSRLLIVTTLLIVAVGLALPFSPLADLLGFVPLPAAYFLFLLVATSTYLLLVEVVKRRLMGRLLG